MSERVIPPSLLPRRRRFGAAASASVPLARGGGPRSPAGGTSPAGVSSGIGARVWKVLGCSESGQAAVSPRGPLVGGSGRLEAIGGTQRSLRLCLGCVRCSSKGGLPCRPSD